MAVDKKELFKLQGEDSTLQKFKETKGTETRKGYEISYIKRGGIWYQIRQRKYEEGNTRMQILVSKLLIEKVIEVVHDSLFGGNLEVKKKTKERIQTNFFWPRLHNDVTSFCRLCNVCQKTVPGGLVPWAPLGDMPLIDQPFKKVAIDLVGPITPASDKGDKYILT